MKKKGGVRMSQEWEQGNAALSYTDSDNPYKPLDYAARLQRAGKQPSSSASSVSYAPGQLYGRSYAASGTPLPPDASAAPTAAPELEPPSYLQPSASIPPAEEAWTEPPVSHRSRRQEPVLPLQEAQPGALYSADLFSHQPTAVMPSGYDDTPFANRMPQEMDFFAEPPAWPDEEPAEEPQEEPVFDDMLEDRPWRDPFTPAAPKEDAPAQPLVPKTAKKAAPPPKPQKPPVRMGRVLALIAAIGMLLFCGIVGGRMVMELSRNEEDIAAARSAYLEQTGVELHNGAVRVELLPAGQTFTPTATPTPTAYAPTPSPTPVIPINEAAVLSLGREALDVENPVEVTATPSLRAKLKTYPKNPLRNIQPGLSELIKENSDVVGRLVIEGVLDEVVMQRNNTYYLTHNSLGTSSSAGAVFADESCSFRMPPENLLLRGSCTVPQKTFHALLQFATGGSAFVSTVPTARLTTLYEEESYVLFAVIAAASDPASADYFNYASYPTFATDEVMMTYVNNARAHSLYQFNVDVQPSDRLLTLATMGGDDTLVLIYRMAREGEGF